MLIGELEQHRHDLRAVGRVQISSGLIGKQNLRLVHNRPCDCDPLLLAAGELGRKVILAMTKPNALQSLDRRLGGINSSDGTRHRDIFQRGQLGQEMEVLKHITNFPIAKTSLFLPPQRVEIDAINPHQTALRTLQSRQRVKQSRLARTARPAQKNPLATTNPQINPMQHLDRLVANPVAAMQVDRFNHRLAHFPESAHPSPPRQARSNGHPTEEVHSGEFANFHPFLTTLAQNLR